MPSLREPGYSRIPQEVTQRDANNREMLGFHQQIYDHAMGRIAANDQVPRYTTLVDKLLGMNPYIQQPSAPASTVMSSPDYRGPMPAAQPATSVMSGPSYRGPMPTNQSQSPGNGNQGGAGGSVMSGADYRGPMPGQSSSTSAMSGADYRGPMPANQSQSPGNGNQGRAGASVMSSPEYQGPAPMSPSQSPGNGYQGSSTGGAMSSPSYQGPMPATNTAPTQITPPLASTGPGPQMNAAPVFQPINPYQPTGGSVVSQPSFMEDPMAGGIQRGPSGINPNKNPLDFNPFGAAQPGLFGSRGSVGRPGGY